MCKREKSTKKKEKQKFLLQGGSDVFGLVMYWVVSVPQVASEMMQDGT